MASHTHGGNRGGLATAAVKAGRAILTADRIIEVLRYMARSRVMEERMIRMSKSGEGFFWIGGPGEEAFNVCLGLQIKKGRGPEFDYLHLHYRNSATLLAMGMSPIDSIRQMAMKATDPNSMGRNFIGHFCRPEWNVLPVTSVIEIQHTIAIGTALVQKRFGGDGITIVTGGDAGTSEGDFASCMIWSSRPNQELPILIVVTNNGWGISTPAASQHSEKRVIDRARAHGIAGEVIDGNDPIASWQAIQQAMAYCRNERRPFMLEAKVSRLHGHSSSSGARRVQDEPDCQELFEEKLKRDGIINGAQIAKIHEDAEAEIEQAIEQVLGEPVPGPDDVRRLTYAPSKVDAVYPGDYTGLPT